MHILNNLPLGTFDLHIHSTASDGVYSPSQIVKCAKSVGLTTIAITDHDTLSGIKEGVEAGRHYSVDVIPGVELSASFRHHTVDILGYNIKDCDTLDHALSVFRDHRKQRALKIIETFTKWNMPLTVEDVKQFSGDGVITRPHIAKAIVKKGYADNVQQVFDKYLADGKPAAIPKHTLTPKQAIDLIRRHGGQAVLAHPIFLQEEWLRDVLEIGFDGIEIWHRAHQAHHVQKFLSYAKKYGLVVTGGSDFHSDEHQLGGFLHTS